MFCDDTIFCLRYNLLHYLTLIISGSTGFSVVYQIIVKNINLCLPTKRCSILVLSLVSITCQQLSNYGQKNIVCLHNNIANVLWLTK